MIPRLGKIVRQELYMYNGIILQTASDQHLLNDVLVVRPVT